MGVCVFMIEEFAAAKINLALHVTGQRADGYHLLDTLVTFADVGDRLQFVPSKVDRFTLSGRFGAALPTDGDTKSGNLVLRARDLLRDHARASGQASHPVQIHLEKNLPVASGIGGGSADAAATLRGLARLWGFSVPLEDLKTLGLKLGADVPMCMESRPLVARGIGEHIRLLDEFPRLHLLVVNPLVEVSTPAIFKSLTQKNNPPLELPTDFVSIHAWIEAIQHARNDLQPAAETMAPEIALTMEMICSTRPLLARMSGSGATCFGIYADGATALAAKTAVGNMRPQWYCEIARTIGGSGHVED
jgi:4-diphosphocytidyl-2-C-methyl-D-erythritol kinase